MNNKKNIFVRVSFIRKLLNKITTRRSRENTTEEDTFWFI
jgi:hypothetical protein